MDRGLATVIGMSIAYVASFAGLAFAWVGWRKRRGDRDGSGAGTPSDPDPGSGREKRP